MKRRARAYSLILFLQIVLATATFGKSEMVDVLVAGGGASGVAAALQSARMGMRVLVVEETPWLGGMLTTAGVSAIDGNYRLPSGIFGEFREELARHYGSMDSLATGWVSKVLFEPSVGNRILQEMVSREKNITVWKRCHIKQIERTNKLWHLTTSMEDGATAVVKARIVIDATELGDIAAQCGVGYDVGMESRQDTHEDIALEQANNVVQDLTYVAVLKDYGRDVSMPKPEGYDPSAFACCCINPLCVSPKEPNRVWPADKMMTYGRLPNGKYMINWPIEGNDFYTNLVEMSPAERDKTLRQAKLHTLRFVYFIQNELGYRHLGFADDEFPTADLLPFIPYHRESRRIHGLVRFTMSHVSDPYGQSEPLYRTGIAVGDYPVDHHHARYKENHTLPDLHFHPIPSFGLPLGTLIPRDAKGLIVAEKSISVSNLINGSTRLQPVVVQIGQAAGALAAIALKQGKEVAEVAVRDVQDAVLAAGGYLLPYLDVPADNPRFKAYQRVGATGLLKGTGKSVDWRNETWIRADSTLTGSDLTGMYDLYKHWRRLGGTLPHSAMTVREALKLINDVAKAEHIPTSKSIDEISKRFDLMPLDESRHISRGEMAVLLDQLLDPFHWKQVDMRGKYEE